MASTFFWRKKPCLRWTNMHSHIDNFSLPRSDKDSSNCLSHSNPADGWPYRCRSRSTTGSSMLDHDFGQKCRGRRLQTSGHCVSGIYRAIWEHPSILTCVWADTASAACPSQLGNLAKNIHYFCSLLGRRRALFSENCVGSRVIFHCVPWSTTLPLYFCNSGSPHFLRWLYVHQMQQSGFSCLVSLPKNNRLFCSWFFQGPMLELFRVFPFLVHCGFGIRNLHRLWHRVELVHLIEMRHGSKSFTYSVEFFSDAIKSFATTFVMLGCLLHGMAGAMGLPVFSSRFLF